jgi:two-component system, cell cycle sensor histidine kinase and response regulator CckA
VTRAAQLAAIVESSNDAIIGKTLDGLITSWNPAAEKMFGYRASEAIGQPITIIIPPECLDEAVQVLSRIRRGETVEHFETVRIAKGGERVSVSVTVSPIKDASGDVVGASKIARDVRERQQADASRSRLAAVVESSEDAIIGKTLDGVITSWNPAAEKMFGYTAVEAIGRPITMLIPEERRAEEEEVLTRIRRGDRVDSFETARVAKDGRRLTVALRVSPVMTPAGRIVGASKIARDITERRRSEMQAEAILEAASEGILVVDQNGGIVSVNGRIEAMFGYSREELLGAPVEVLLPERLRSAHCGHRATYFLDPHVRPMGRGRDLLARRRDGREFPVEISLSYVQTENGVRGLAFVTDITHRQATELATRQAERLSAVGRMAAGIAHEVNNPIGVLTSRIELMLLEAEGNKLPAETVEDLRVLHRQTMRVATIAKTLLSFSRPSAPDRDLVDLNEVVGAVLMLVQKEYARHAVHVVPDLQENLPHVLGHANALEQVLLNLMTNAAQAMATGGQVMVTTAVHADRVRLMVADNGPGIDPENVANIFEPFFTTKPSGTGLGLSVAHDIIKDHNGTIDVQSTPEHGTRFILSFPVATAPPGESETAGDEP